MMFLAILSLIALLAFTIKYPMIPLFFFLTTALFKAALMVRFSIFTRYDVTVLSALFVMFGMIVAVAKRPRQFSKVFNAPYLLMVLLAVILFLGLAYTSAPNYGWAKSSRFFSLCFADVSFSNSIYRDEIRF